MRTYGFLAASFISMVGDMLLVFSLPTGIGKETGNMSSAVIFWLIPAAAVIVSSFLGKYIKKRSGNERVDYAKLLIVIAAIELVISYLTFQFKSPSIVLALSCIFVFLYAFTKEGISRLFYNVAVYRFFCTPEQYAELAGIKGGLDVLGGIVGIALASYFVDHNSWRLALIADASTFVIISSAIYWLGQDPRPEADVKIPAMDISEVEEPKVPSEASVGEEEVRLIKLVLIGIAGLHAINALYANYQPLINERLNIISASSSILLIALLRTPGAACGLFTGKITKVIPASLIIKFYPVIHLAFSLSFLLFPHFLTMGLVIVSGGIGVGVYIPTSISLLNKFSMTAIVDINVLISRWLGVFQISACLIAMILFSSDKIPLLQLGLWMLVFYGLSFFILRIHGRYFASLVSTHD